LIIFLDVEMFSFNNLEAFGIERFFSVISSIRAFLLWIRWIGYFFGYFGVFF
jgi:hypothetical protein